MAKVVGYNAKFFIGDPTDSSEPVEPTNPYRVARWEFDDGVTDLEIGDSVDGRYEAHEGGRYSGHVMLENATFDPLDNPFAAPYNVQSGAHVCIYIWPDGILVGTPHRLYNVLVTSAKHQGEIGGKQPFTMSGVLSGPYDPADIVKTQDAPGQETNV